MEKEIILSDLESNIIVKALNVYWHDANKQLLTKTKTMSNGEKRPLGRIEREMLIERKVYTQLTLKRFKQ